jgi:predicted Co/Zn/Cd cation transporter (cation efflux family)
MLDITPKKERYELALQIFVYVKDKLNKDIIEILLSYTPKEHKQEIQALIDKYQQKDVVNELRLMVRKILKENY